MAEGAPEDPIKIEINSDQSESTRIVEENEHSEGVKSCAKKLFPSPGFDENGEHFFAMEFRGKPMRQVYSEAEYERDLWGVEWELIQTGVDDADLPQFVEYVSALNNFFNETEEWKNAYGIKTVIKLGKNLDQVKQFSELTNYWKAKESQKVEGGDMKPVGGKTVGKVFEQLSGAFISPERGVPDVETSKQIIDTLLEYHQITQSLSPDYQKGVRNFEYGIEGCCFENHDTYSAHELNILLRDSITKNTSPESFEKFADSVSRYTRHLSLTKEVADKFRDYLLPAISRQDANVQILVKPSNSWAMRRGEFSIGEYTCRLYSEVASPQYINELILINSEIPTAVANHFEQNRRDGSSLTRINGLGLLKEAIHDQRPKNHDVIKAMVDFYDGKISPDELLNISETHDYLGREGKFAEEAIKKQLYDETVEERTADGTRDVKVIDILRRLEKNTSPIPDLPPKTGYDSFDTALNRLSNLDSASSAQRGTLAEALYEANKVLEGLYKNGQVGIDSRFITALSFLNRSVASALRSMSFEEQVRAYRETWFSEAIKFHDLTSSPSKYDADRTNEFIRLVQQEHTLGAYQKLGQKIVQDLGTLGRNYKDRGFGRWSEMLWSGNLDHELMGLIDLREPLTPEGKAYKERFLSNEEERLKGD